MNYIKYILIILLLILTLHISNYKESFEQKKALLVLYGESFRDGLQNDRTSATKKGFNGQMVACDSHIKFIETIKRKYNIDVEISISTYCTKYNEELKNKYSNYKLYFNCEKDLIGWNPIANKALNKLNVNNYEFIIFTRNDICFKDEFINNYTINNDKLLFVSQQWTKHDCTENLPEINPIILCIPKKYFYVTKNISIDHDGWRFYKNNYNLNNNDMGFLLNTYHDADSYKDYNPYYYMVGRDQTSEWYDKDKINNNYNTDNIFCYNSR